MWWKAIDPAHERRRLGNEWRGQPGTWVQPSEERRPVPNYPAITRIAEGGTHYVKLSSMPEEKRFRNWNSALRFFEDNATPSDRVRCARAERAVRRGSHSQATPARVFRTKPGAAKDPRPPPEEPLPPEEPPPSSKKEEEQEEPLQIDDVDFTSLEALLGNLGSSSIDTEVPSVPFDLPETRVFTDEEMQVLRANESSSVSGYRGVKLVKSRLDRKYPFVSTVQRRGVCHTLGTHATAEEAALHAAKAREGLNIGNVSHRYFERWNKGETERLIASVHEHECGDVTPRKGRDGWQAVAQHVGTRTVQQCYRRWEAVNPNMTEQQKEALDRKRARDVFNARERKHARLEAAMGITPEWLATTAGNVDDASFKELETIDGTFLRANETLHPSDHFYVDARHQRVTPAKVFVFNPHNTKPFHFDFGARVHSTPSQPTLTGRSLQVLATPIESSVEPPEPPEPPVATQPEPKITDYLLVRKKRCPKATISKEASPQSNAQRVLDLAAAL